MFTLEHFIWLGAIALISAVALVLLKRYKPSHRAVHAVMTAMLIVFKLFHLSVSMKESEFGGLVLMQSQLSFHLCSIQVYLVIFLNFIKNEALRTKLKSFMVPCMLIGAGMALLIPTEGVAFDSLRVWQYMLIHGGLVFYGLYFMLVEKVPLGIKAYFNNLEYLLVITVVAFFMNSMLDAYNVNFLFLRVPPMEGLPILNLDNGWYIYFLNLTLVACGLVLIVQLPFIIKELAARCRERKKNK